MTEPDSPAPAPFGASAAALAALRIAAETDDDADLELGPFFDVATAIVRGAPGFDRDAMITAAAPLVPEVRAGLTAYGDRLERLLLATFYGDEWAAACERRTRLEAVFSLWAAQLAGLEPMSVDREALDDLLRQKGDHEGGLRPDQIPPGTPTSHWWWWYPAAPPS